jgi:hypothetical protein
VYRTPPLRPSDEIIVTQLPPGERWQGDRHSVYVTFDAQDRVAQVTGFFPGPVRRAGIAPSKNGCRYPIE